MARVLPVHFFTSSRELLLRLVHLRHCHLHNVPILWIAVAVVLVVLLGRIECFQFHYPRHNGCMEDLRLIQPSDLGFGDAKAARDVIRMKRAALIFLDRGIQSIGFSLDLVFL